MNIDVKNNKRIVAALFGFVLIAASCAARPVPQTQTSLPVVNVKTGTIENIGGETASSSLAEIFDWKAAGLAFSLPPDWTIASLTRSEAETSSRIQLVSSTNRTPAGYFCVDLEINPVAASYRLEGGSVVEILGDSRKIYQREYISNNKPQLQAWLTGDDLSSSINVFGKTLFAQVTYSCISGDLDFTTSSYRDQEDSQVYRTAINLLESLTPDEAKP